MKLKHVLTAGALVLVLGEAAPAFAGLVNPAPAPAPVAGIGVGALALLGLGYRALKRRSDR